MQRIYDILMPMDGIPSETIPGKTAYVCSCARTVRLTILITFFAVIRIFICHAADMPVVTEADLLSTKGKRNEKTCNKS